MAAETGRMQKLQAMLQRQPNDVFLLYALALEHKKAMQPQEALQCLGRVIELDGGYCYAYYQQGQIHEMSGDVEAAAGAYRAGVAAASAKGDAHARQELEAALSMMEQN